MNKLLFILFLLTLSQINYSQVKDYELGTSQIGGRGNYSGGFFDYSDPMEVNIKVAVWGFVKYPGRYTVPISTTTTDLLSYAGGPTDDALPDILRLYRRYEDGSQQLTEFSFNDILWGDGLEEKNREVPNLQAGDILVVPGTQRVYFMDWAQLSLAIISTVVSVATLIIVISR